ncbi:MAG: hypothetical protein K2Y31_11515 [Burkholderiales bacterium]|nr:hypothetical protein [Burkholderiales bacterium]
MDVPVNGKVLLIAVLFFGGMQMYRAMINPFIFIGFLVLIFPVDAQSWSYRVNPQKDHETQCINPSGVPVGGWRSCRDDGTCHNGNSIIERCEIRYGEKKGGWSYVVNPKIDTETKCVDPSGNTVGDWVSCHTGNVCNNAAAIIDKCQSKSKAAPAPISSMPTFRTSTPGSSIFIYVTNKGVASYACSISFSFAHDSFGEVVTGRESTTVNIGPNIFDFNIYKKTGSLVNLRMTSALMTNCNRTN